MELTTDDLTGPRGRSLIRAEIRRLERLHGGARISVSPPSLSGRFVQLQESRDPGRLAKLTGTGPPYPFVWAKGNPDGSFADDGGPPDGSVAREINGLNTLDSGTHVLMRRGGKPGEYLFQYIAAPDSDPDHPTYPTFCLELWGCNGHTKKLTITVTEHGTGLPVGTLANCNHDNPLCVELKIDGTQYDVTGSGEGYTSRTWTITPPVGSNPIALGFHPTDYPYHYVFILAQSDATKVCACGCPDPVPKTLKITDRYGEHDLLFLNPGMGLTCPPGYVWGCCFKADDGKSVRLEWYRRVETAQCDYRCNGSGAVTVKYCLSCGDYLYGTKGYSYHTNRWTLTKYTTVTTCNDGYGVRARLAELPCNRTGYPDCAYDNSHDCDWCVDSSGTFCWCTANQNLDCGSKIDLTFDLPGAYYLDGSGFSYPVPDMADTVTVTE